MKTRFRIKRGWFGSSIVLQVGFPHNVGCYGLPYSHKEFRWRDATEEDWLDRTLGGHGPARSGADILLGRFDNTPEACPAQQASTTEN